MQNYKDFTTHNGNEEAFETEEPVTWKPGEPLLGYHVFNIEVLEEEFALIKQNNRGRFTTETVERLEHVYCWAKDIFKLSGKYAERQRAAHLIRECDRLQSECYHNWDMKNGFIVPGTPFDEDEWAKGFERLQSDIAEHLRRWN
jgi:hypothetical protein